MADNPFAALSNPSTAFAPQPEQPVSPSANPFQGLAAYSSMPKAGGKQPKLPGSVNSAEPLRWIMKNGHPIPITAPSGADHMLPVAGNTNVVKDPLSGEHYFKTPDGDGKFTSIWDTQRKVAKGGNIVSHVKGVGDKIWGPDPKVAQKAQTDEGKQDTKDQKAATTQAAGDTQEVLADSKTQVTTAKETMARTDKLFTSEVAKATTNRKLSMEVKSSTQQTANEAYVAAQNFLKDTHNLDVGRHQALDADGLTRYKAQKLPEGMSSDQYKEQDAALRKDYKDKQALANSAKGVDDENKRFIATAQLHKQAWIDQSRPLRQGLQQTTDGLNSFAKKKIIAQGRTAMDDQDAQRGQDWQANQAPAPQPVRADWPLKTNTGRNADNSAQPPQITPPADFNQYNASMPQPTPEQRAQAGDDMIKLVGSGAPQMTITPRASTSGSFLPMPVRKLAVPTQDQQDEEDQQATTEARNTLLKGLQNTNRGMAYVSPDKPQLQWDKDTLTHEGKPVGAIQRNEAGAPALYLNHDASGQTVSPSLNSGHYYDGIPEMASPSPSHLAELQAQGVTKPDEVQKAWAGRHWGTQDVNDFVDQWTQGNDSDRQDLIAQTNQSQLNVPAGQRRLDTREMYKNGLISAQDARMFDHAFYGRKPGVEDPTASFEQFKKSDNPDAQTLAKLPATGSLDATSMASGKAQPGILGSIEHKAAYERAVNSWAADYFKRNSTSADFDRPAFLAARDKMLPSASERGMAAVGNTAEGLAGFGMSMVGQTAGEALGLAKAGGGLALRKLGLDPQGFKDFANLYGGDQLMDAANELGVHPHDAQERDMVAQGSQHFANSWVNFIKDHTTPGNIWSGKNASVVHDTTDKIFDAIDRENMTPDLLKQLSGTLQDATVKLHGLSNFDASNQKGHDYGGRFNAMDPRSPLTQALAAYAETADPAYKEMFRETLRTSQGADELKAKMTGYLQARGHIQGSAVGSVMSWLNNISGGALHYDSPDAWRSLSESAGNGVQPLQILGLSELLGATSAMPKLLKGIIAPELKTTGRALLSAGEVVNGATPMAKALQRVSTIPVADVLPQSAGQAFVKQMGTSAAHGAGFMALQQPGMGADQSLGDIAKAGVEGAAIGGAMGVFNASSTALDVRKRNAAQNQAHEDFVSNWNKSYPKNPITTADSRQASHYMGADEVPRLQAMGQLVDQYNGLKAKVDARTATREDYAQMRSLNNDIQTQFVLQQHAMSKAMDATQEINGIVDPTLRGWANGALKSLSGSQLTPVEETTMNTAVNEQGLPLSRPNGDGTHTITDAGLAAMDEVAPVTRKQFFPSDETSQTTTPDEQSPVQPAQAGMPAPVDQSPQVTPETTEGQPDVAGEPRVQPEVGSGQGSLEQGMGGNPAERQETRSGESPRGGKTAETLADPPTEVDTVGRVPSETITEGRVDAPPEKVNPASSSPEPATQADPVQVQKDTGAVKLTVNQHMAKAVAAVATALGEKIVDTGIPSGYTSFGKHINFGTQMYDKLVPGDKIGRWMDGLVKDNPQVHEFLQHTHTPSFLHRMWFGHDWLMNWGKIKEQFGAGSLPDYVGQLFKDNLTHEGLPLPGAQWIWEKGLVDRTEGNADWLSMNIGEEMSAGIAVTGTAMLFKKLLKGEPIHDGWALTGMLVKAGTGLLQHNPILMLTSAADVAIIAAANTKSIAKAFRLRAERRKALDEAVKPGEKKLNFKAPEVQAQPQTSGGAETSAKSERSLVLEATKGGAQVDKPTDTGEVKVREATPHGGEPIPPKTDYQGIARQQIEDQLKDSPALRKLVDIRDDVPEHAQDTSGMFADENNITVSLPQLDSQLQGMTPEEAKTHVSKVLDEEVRHVAHVQAARRLYDQRKMAGLIPEGQNFAHWMHQHYSKMWKEFSPEQQQYVLDSYGKTLDAQPDSNKAMEAIRIISQRRATGDQSETSMLWQKLPQAVLEHLKAVFDYLKDLSKQKLAPVLERELANIEQVLKEHNYGQKNGESEALNEASRALNKGAATHISDVKLTENEGQFGQYQFSNVVNSISNEVASRFSAHGSSKIRPGISEDRTPAGRALSLSKHGVKSGDFGTLKGESIGVANTITTAPVIVVRHEASGREVVIVNHAGSQKAVELLRPFANADRPIITPAELPEWIEGIHSKLDAKAHEAATSPHNDLPEPTQAMKEAENYQVGKIKVAGLNISIENPHGSMRKGTSPEGKPWQTEMKDHYGRIRGSLSVDGDHLDVFVKPGTPEDFDGNVYVVHQMDPKTGKLDEFKSMLGYGSKEEAQAAYQANYSKGWKGMGKVVEMTIPDFKAEMQRMTEAQKAAKAAPKVGWKLHLATGSPEEVSAILKQNGLTHKVGRNSEQTGKDITVYSGSREQAEVDAKLINSQAGHLLDIPHGDVLEHDAPINGRVMGRFDVSDKTSDKYNQYGSNGVPHLNEDVSKSLWDENHDPSEMESRAHEELTKDFGEFYTGKQGESKPLTDLRTSNGQLPPAAQKAWTPEAYAKAEQFYKSGDQKALDGLNTIQKRRVIHFAATPEDIAREAAAEKTMRQQQADDAKHYRATTEKDLQSAPIKRSPEEIAKVEARISKDQETQSILDLKGTSLKNDVAEAELKARGEEPLGKIKAGTKTSWEAEADQQLKYDPTIGMKTVENIITHPRVMLDWENEAVLRTKKALEDRGEEISEMINDPKVGSEIKKMLGEEATAISEQYNKIYQAASFSGTKWSDQGRARQSVLFSGENLEGIMQMFRNAKGGKALTEKEIAEARDIHQEIVKAKKADDQVKIDETAPQVSKALGRAVVDASKPLAPSKGSIKTSAAQTIRDRAAAARARLASREVEPLQSAPLRSAPLKLDAQTLADYTDVAVEHMLEGRNLGDEMVKEFGESIRQHLGNIVTEAQKVHDQIMAEATKVEKAKAEKKAAKLVPANVMKAAAAGEYGDGLDPKWMHELAMAHIVEGHKDGNSMTENELIKRMLKDVRTLHPDVTEWQVRDALSGYGKTSEPSREENAKTLRDLKAQARLLSATEDARQGKAPLRSGIQRDKPSPEQRELTKELHRIMDEQQVAHSDPSKELATRQDRIRNQLRNQIEELQRVIEGEAKPQKGVAQIADTPEIAKLREQVSELRKAVLNMDSVKEASEQARVNAAVKAAEISKAEYERRVAQMDFSTRSKRGEEPNESVLAARKARDAARENFEDLKDAANMYLPGALFKEAQGKLSVAVKREAELKAKLAAGDLSVRKHTAGFETSELAEARAKVKTLQTAMLKARDAARPRLSPEEQARVIYLKRVGKSIAEVERRIKEQDFASKPKKDLKHNKATTAAKVALGKAKDRLHAAIKAKELADRSLYRRGADRTVHVLREIKLANLLTSGEKLGGAALENILTRPLSQLAAATTVIPKIVGIHFLDDVRKKATYEGSLNQNAEWAGLKRMASKEGFKAVWNKVVHGKSDIDWVHKDPHFTEEMTSYFGRVHGGIKEPIRQGVYARALKIQSDIAEKAGIDWKKDEFAALEASARAYEIANQEIYMGDNLVTSLVRAGIRYAENNKAFPDEGKVVADVINVLLPIINVPTNLAWRVSLLNPAVGFSRASWVLGRAALRGQLKDRAKTLPEREAESFMRAYKYGMLGLAVGAYAWTHPQNFGGVNLSMNHPGGNEDKSLKAGEIKIPGTEVVINHHLAHGPLGSHLNIIADARREFDRIAAKTGSNSRAALQALSFATFAPVQQLPYTQVILRAFASGKPLGQAMAATLRDYTVGTPFTNWYDRDEEGEPVRRKAADAVDELKLAVPGLRQQVPEKTESRTSAPASPFSGLSHYSRPRTHRRLYPPVHR